MAVTPRSTLAAQILSLLADNTSGDISAADVRTILTNLTDSIDHISEGGADRSLEASIKLDSTKGNQYNLEGTARTGALSIDSTVVRMGMAVIRHNDSSVPAISITGGGSVYFPAEGVSSLSDIYTVDQDNYLLLICTGITAGALQVAVMPWAGANSTLSGLSDTTISSPANSQGLRYFSGNWINEALPRYPEYNAIDPSSGYNANPVSSVGDFCFFARLDTAVQTLDLGDHSAVTHATRVLIANHEESSYALTVEAPDGFTASGSGKIPYTITAGPPESITIEPGECIILIRTGGPGTWNCVFNVRNPLGDAISLDATTTASPGGVIAPLALTFGTQYVDTHAAPATSGAISVTSSEGVGAHSYILYQAASEPTLTGISKDGTWNWDASGINIIVVHHHPDGYRALHLGTAAAP